MALLAGGAGTDQGRLLFPRSARLVTLLAAGWLALIPLPASGGDGCDRRIGRGAGSHGLLGVIRPALAPPPPATVANPVEPVRFGDLTLVGWNWTRSLVLYWQLAAQAGTDYRTVLRHRRLTARWCGRATLARRGSLQHRSPAAGLRHARRLHRQLAGLGRSGRVSGGSGRPALWRGVAHAQRHRRTPLRAAGHA
ncbi:MAG: hypothetical protein R3A10_21955 [Caldilineaceae bacterium]